MQARRRNSPSETVPNVNSRYEDRARGTPISDPAVLNQRRATDRPRLRSHDHGQTVASAPGHGMEHGTAWRNAANGDSRDAAAAAGSGGDVGGRCRYAKSRPAQPPKCTCSIECPDLHTVPFADAHAQRVGRDKPDRGDGVRTGAAHPEAPVSARTRGTEVTRRGSAAEQRAKRDVEGRRPTKSCRHWEGSGSCAVQPFPPADSICPAPTRRPYVVLRSRSRTRLRIRSACAGHTRKTAPDRTRDPGRSTIGPHAAPTSPAA